MKCGSYITLGAHVQQGLRLALGRTHPCGVNRTHALPMCTCVHVQVVVMYVCLSVTQHLTSWAINRSTNNWSVSDVKKGEPDLKAEIEEHKRNFTLTVASCISVIMPGDLKVVRNKQVFYGGWLVPKLTHSWIAFILTLICFSFQTERLLTLNLHTFRWTHSKLDLVMTLRLPTVHHLIHKLYPFIYP